MMKKIVQAIFIANAALTLPFGIMGLAAPAAIFSGFGLELDTAGQLIARGYAAALTGFGLLFLLLRNPGEARVERVMLVAALAFNGIETILQLNAAITGIVLPIIWITIIVHLILTLLCLYALLFLKR